jgi:hypothetical protein
MLMLDVPGVEFTDLNEGINLLQVGYSNAAALKPAMLLLAELGVPLTAVDFVRVLHAKPEIGVPPLAMSGNSTFSGQRIDQVFRPLRGGIEIGFGLGSACTMGFLIADGSQFVTNSHCTASMFALDGRRFYQLSPADEDHFIGTEVLDPGTYACGGTACRNSDAAIVQLQNPNIPADWGYIVRTSFPNGGGRSGGYGSLEEDAIFPTWRLSAKHTFVLQNWRLEKVGRTTGWTWGTVLNTCADYNGPGYRLVCQVRASYYSQGGDSGSPVLDWHHANYGAHAYLAGIHWGSTGGTSASDYAWFSPISRVEMDLGSLDVVRTY